jgi:hypothetical protein
LLFSSWRGSFTVNLFIPTLRQLSDFYYDVLRCLRENMQQKRPELSCNQNWLLHHDNVPAHTSLKTTEFVTNNQGRRLQGCGGSIASLLNATKIFLSVFDFEKIFHTSKY